MGTVSVVVLAALVGCVVLMLRGREGLRTPGPRLSPDLPAALLLRAGFPVTAHNVRAVHERLASAFLDMARALSPEIGARVVAALEPDALAQPQPVLDAIAETDPSMAVRLASRTPEDLLATAGTGRGFFGGSVFVPLPVVGPRAAGVATAIPAPRSGPVVAAPAVSPAPPATV